MVSARAKLSPSLEQIGFAEHRRGYHTGSGDQLFHVLQSQIHRVLEAKHPALERDPERLAAVSQRFTMQAAFRISSRTNEAD
jgi:hypothetical protein